MLQMKMAKLNRFTACQSPSSMDGSHRITAKRLQNRNRLAGRAKFAYGLLVYKPNPIHICNRHDFCQYH